MAMPHDVLYEIGDIFLHGRDRASFSMVSRGLLPLRSERFQRLSLTSGDYTYPEESSAKLHLLDIVRGNGITLGYVKDLKISNAGAPQVSTCVEIITALISTARIETVHLDIDWYYETPAAVELENALVRLLTLPTITSIAFSKGLIPIVKIMNALEQESQPIQNLTLYGCKFTLIEIQVQHIEPALAPPPFNFFTRSFETRQAEDALMAAAERLAPVHLGKRWLPTQMDFMDSPTFWSQLLPFIDTDNLTTLTLDWPPHLNVSNFNTWSIPNLERLRIVVSRLSSSRSWVPLGNGIGALGARFLFIKFEHQPDYGLRTIAPDIQAFLLGAATFDNITIKFCLFSSAIEEEITGSGEWITLMLSSVNPNITSLTLGFSLKVPLPVPTYWGNNPRPRRRDIIRANIRSRPWGASSNFCRWLDIKNASMQQFLPPNTDFSGQEIQVGLFWEKDQVDGWDLTRPGAEEVPAWVSAAVDV
ncbi:hypothetical protein GALMADRAFT_147498 [Galerina marginata CBS 339.88]|uniref:Uncharacterized protein n=1 Tax=Galerina marginata (strain CBS 339.88) TaxID=685588 RepID=A0A067SJZ5_GALM3|nr:hypothetical protein GALMADRAFT_147498 [Galerina marginata CBS 339.88]